MDYIPGSAGRAYSHYSTLPPREGPQSTRIRSSGGDPNQIPTGAHVKTRTVTIFSGHVFEVPQSIQRIDHRATHGWQLRYGGTKLYSDHTNDGSGATESLRLATRELLKRIAELPAPSLLQRGPSVNKRSGLPVGISGPIVRQRRGSELRDCSLAVLIPRFADTPQRKSVYIGTENTYTQKRFKEALKEAVLLRQEAVEAYEAAATKARRAEAREYRKKLKAEGAL
jgi:hypothetical protein